MLIEVIATTVKEALDIEKSGADRIELVSGIIEGGLTPSISLIKAVCEKVTIPVNVMVRPHSKSFIYDSHDLEVIYNDILQIKNTKANGIVFGCLNDDKSINIEVLKKVISLKGDLDLTFHRAIDVTTDIVKEFSNLLNYDITTILTSAGVDNVTTNVDLLNNLHNLASQKNITVLAGSGINLDNVYDFCQEADVTEMHIGSAAKFDKNNLNDIDVLSLRQMIETLKEKVKK